MTIDDTSEQTAYTAPPTTVLEEWLESELHEARKVAQRALTRAEALGGLLAFTRDAQADLGAPVDGDDLLPAASRIGGERKRAEVAALIEQMGDPLA